MKQNIIHLGHRESFMPNPLDTDLNAAPYKPHIVSHAKAAEILEEMRATPKLVHDGPGVSPMVGPGPMVWKSREAMQLAIVTLQREAASISHWGRKFSIPETKQDFQERSAELYEAARILQYNWDAVIV